MTPVSNALDELWDAAEVFFDAWNGAERVLTPAEESRMARLTEVIRDAWLCSTREGNLQDLLGQLATAKTKERTRDRTR